MKNNELLASTPIYSRKAYFKYDDLSNYHFVGPELDYSQFDLFFRQLMSLPTALGLDLFRRFLIYFKLHWIINVPCLSMQCIEMLQNVDLIPPLQ